MSIFDKWNNACIKNFIKQNVRYKFKVVFLGYVLLNKYSLIYLLLYFNSFSVIGLLEIINQQQINFYFYLIPKRFSSS